jgi:DNA polymerase-4
MKESYRKIIHIDMDAFYASIEQRDHPDLRNKPVAVGGSSKRGVVTTASYEARKYGVHSAMPSVLAKQKCPGLIFVEPRFEVYKSVSNQILKIFYEYTPLVEPLSLDEAFLDVTENKKGIPSATIIAKEIKKEIRSRTSLTASAGISVNKFLAKVASDYNKPDGLFLIKPDEAEEFVENLAIEKFFGIGKVTAEKMHKMGIHNGRDLKKFSQAELINLFGKAGAYFYDMARAIDNRPVNPDRIRKSVGAERTFEEDLTGREEILSELYIVEKILIERLERSKFTGRTLTLKVKFADFEQITRSKTHPEPLTDNDILHQISVELINNLNISEKGIRLLGLTVSNITEKDLDKAQQLTLDF